MTGPSPTPGRPPARGAHDWRSTAWKDEAVAWLDAELARVGRRRTGPVEQPHLEPWSTVLRAPTDDGPVWLKATSVGTAAEIPLSELLAELVPDRVLVPIATDPDRAWVLLPDGGPRLGDHLNRVGLVDGMAAVVGPYARLQRTLSPRVDDLVALGLADMRPAVLPDRLDEAVEWLRGSLHRAGPGAPELLEAVSRLRPTVTAWCAELADLPGVASIDHNDLHDENVLVRGADRLGQPRFYDWGDAVVAHAFASLLFPLTILRGKGDGTDDDPGVRRVRDAYLAEFADLGPEADLVRALELACHLGKIARTLTWARAVALVDDEQTAAAYVAAPVSTLRALLDESYLGGT